MPVYTWSAEINGATIKAQTSTDDVKEARKALVFAAVYRHHVNLIKVTDDGVFFNAYVELIISNLYPVTLDLVFIEVPSLEEIGERIVNVLADTIEYQEPKLILIEATNE